MFFFKMIWESRSTVSGFSTFSSVNTKRNISNNTIYIFSVDGGTSLIALISSNYSSAVMF